MDSHGRSSDLRKHATADVTRAVNKQFFKRMLAFILALHKSPSPWAFRRVKQKDHKVGASLSYIGRSFLKNKNKKAMI